LGANTSHFILSINEPNGGTEAKLEYSKPFLQRQTRMLNEDGGYVQERLREGKEVPLPS
jgi:hypothetical protein